MSSTLIVVGGLAVVLQLQKFKRKLVSRHGFKCFDAERTIFEFYSLVPVELRALRPYFVAKMLAEKRPISMEISVA